ncbi:MAG: CBS domain-containing protein, partial [Acutalibacteraceae bacterium]
MSIASLILPKANVAYLKYDSSIRQGLEKMKAHSYSAVPVIDEEGKYKGTVSEGDFLWEICKNEFIAKKDLEKEKISDIMDFNLYKSVKITASTDEV